MTHRAQDRPTTRSNSLFPSLFPRSCLHGALVAMLMLVTSACGDDSDPPPPSSNEIFDSHSECETSDDHVWSVTISSVMDDVKISETHSFDFEPMACDSF